MRAWMTQMRKDKKLSFYNAAALCQSTKTILQMLEEDETCITHPNVAARIASVYGMDVEQYNSLIHKDKRVDTLPQPKDPPSPFNFKAYAQSIKEMQKLGKTTQEPTQEALEAMTRQLTQQLTHEFKREIEQYLEQKHEQELVQEGA